MAAVKMQTMEIESRTLEGEDCDFDLGLEESARTPKSNTKQRHMQNLTFSIDAQLSSAIDAEHSQYFDLLQWQQKIQHDVTRWGMCRRCLLCVERMVATTRHLYTSVVPCCCACVTQFYITGTSSDPQKGLWYGILVGMILSTILVSVSLLIANFASIPEPLNGHKIYLTFSRCGRVNTLLALLLLSLTIALLISVEKQCTSTHSEKSPPCTLNQIFSGGLFH